MYLTYVDDSGSSDYGDRSKYFVLSGVIINQNNVKDMKEIVCDFKKDNLVEEYIDAEIHTQQIYKFHGEFTNISKDKRDDLLTKLYELVSSLNITMCSVIVDKESFKK